MDLKIYIVGKVTGEDPDSCREKFAAMEKNLKRIGIHTVINPLNMGIPISWTWEQAKEICLDVLKRKANSIFLLDDWVTSTGSMEEHKFARHAGYRIYDQSDLTMLATLRNAPTAAQWTDTSAFEFP